MNVVNFSDGDRRPGRRRLRDLRRSPSRSSPSTSARTTPGVLAAITAGAALGFLVHNFHPASVFMGDCGSNLLGLLLGGDHRRGLAQDERPDRADRARSSCSPCRSSTPASSSPSGSSTGGPSTTPTRTTSTTASTGSASRSGARCSTSTAGRSRWRALAVALRFVPYSDDRGDWHLGWSLVMAAASRSRSPRASTSCSCSRSSSCGACARWQMRHADPGTDRARDRRARSSASSRRASSGALEPKY